jgi:hypothetical protein
MTAPLWIDIDELDYLEEEELAFAEEEKEEILRQISKHIDEKPEV